MFDNQVFVIWLASFEKVAEHKKDDRCHIRM